MKNALHILILVLIGTNLSFGQCQYVADDYDDFEFAGVDPYLQTGTVYHFTPQTWVAYSGTNSIYMNFVNNLAPGTLVYDRPYTVCPGRTYRMNVWFIETWGGSSDITLEMVDGNGTILDTWQGIIGSAAWFNYISNPVVPTTATLTFKLYSNGMAGSNDLSMDDLTLESCALSTFNTSVSFCPNQNASDLFDALPIGTTQTGTWNGPSALTNGYQGTFDPLTNTQGAYQYVIAGSGGNCPGDTFTVNVSTFNNPVDLGPDTTLCTGGTMTLDAGAGYDLYLWQDGTTNQTYNVTTDGQYWCQAGFLGGNIITNGDFEQGNNSFSTSYGPGTGGTWGLLSNPGTYAISTSPNLTHNNFAVCGDHTSGTGQMMIVNGATVPNTQVWCQTVSVQPNTDYQFSTWAMSAVNGTNVALLQFSIGGVNLGSVFSPSPTACVWQQFATTWNSGANTSVQICVVNQNTSGGGNDFCLDDIYFAPICLSTDTIDVIYQASPVVNLGPDVAFCAGDSVTFDAGNPGLTYAWSTGGVNQTETVLTAGNVSVDVTDALGCVGTDNVNVTVTPFPTPDLGPDTIICADASVTFTVNGAGQTFLWNDGTTNNTLTATTDGTYWVQADDAGCVSSDTVVVTTTPLPVVDLGPDTSFCAGNSMTLDAGNPGATYIWTTNDVTSTLVVNTTSFYGVFVTDAFGCSASDTMNLTVSPPPVVNLGPDLIICDGETTTWTQNGAGQTYVWNDGTTNASLTASTSGIYWVDANLGGCIERDSVELTVTPLPVFDLGADTTLCEGELLPLDPGVAGADYLWNTGETTQQLVVDTIGLYEVTAYKDNCEFTDEIDVQYIFLPTVDIGNDTTICDETPYPLEAIMTNGTSFEWFDGSEDPIYVLNKTETVYITVTNTCGIATDTIDVMTDLCDCFVYVPNAFTPNNDGINDKFYVKSECQWINFTFRIFDRWGNLLFESKDPNIAWEGKYGNMTSPDGVYVWRLDYDAMVNNEAKAFTEIGHVTILR